MLFQADCGIKQIYLEMEQVGCSWKRISNQIRTIAVSSKGKVHRNFIFRPSFWSHKDISDLLVH